MIGGSYFGQVALGGLPGGAAAAQEYVASGGISAGGAAAVAWIRVPLVSGGLAIAGAASTSKVSIYVPAIGGAAIASGAAAVCRVRVPGVGGGLELRPQGGTDFTRLPYRYGTVTIEPTPWRRRRRLRVVG